MNSFEKMTVSGIKEYISQVQMQSYPELIPVLKEDSRVAVKKIGESLAKKVAVRENEVARIITMNVLIKIFL